MIPYVSIDIETTGLDPNKHSIIEFGAIIDDWKTPIDQLPRFHAYINDEDMIWNNYCVSLHSKLVKHLEKGVFKTELMQDFHRWLNQNNIEKIVPAGKNFYAFDFNFIKLMPYFAPKKWKVRGFDPGPLFFELSDTQIPSLKECAEKAGIEYNEDDAHNALYDAELVVKLLRKHYIKVFD